MKNRGMTLFIAVVVMGVLLFVSFAVVNVAIKGSLFASSGRDSQVAFYAADAGLECALYWDAKPATGSAFATSTSGSPIDCSGSSISNGQAIPGSVLPTLIGGGGSGNPTSIFYFTLNQGLNPMTSCAIVTVDKYYTGSNLITHIKSKGYNTCDTTNPRRVERGIEVTY
jgi:hypothetical protein